MSIDEKFKRLKEEDFIWIVYFFIAAAALYSNNEERKYYLTRNNNFYKKQKTINIIILTIAFFIYLYFILNQTEDLKNMEKNFYSQTYRENFARLIASILFLVGGAIYVVLEIVQTEPDEVGFI